MTWGKGLVWAGVAFFVIGAVWFLLMAALPAIFAWTPQFAWCFVAGFLGFGIGAGGAAKDDIWPLYDTEGDGPFTGSEMNVSLDSFGTDGDD